MSAMKSTSTQYSYPELGFTVIVIYKAKSSLGLIKHDAMRAWGGLEV
jgi:hypothetical protein